jgi:hypothetical protein
MMDRELETMFDIVLELEAPERNICRRQQAITMTRVASWLRIHGEEDEALAIKLDNLAEVALTNIEE